MAVDRIVEVLDEPETIRNRPGARRLSQPRGGLEYREVSFAYQPGGRTVLDHIDLHIEPGTTLGILGASGSGKSTLLALAPRIYDPDPGQGSVLVDGRDVRELALEDLRRNVALVPQRTVLFEGTIRTNLIYGAPGASPLELRRALRTAVLDDLVEGMPLGLETPVGERGYTLSGGQRQRLALARALLARPVVLLLDDCTSALDAQTEAWLQANLRAARDGRTCVVVSNKVSSVRGADRIIVLGDGRIAEQGTHAEHLGRAGLYARTYRLQTELTPHAGRRPAHREHAVIP